MLREIVAGKSCILAGKSCGKISCEIFTGNSCRKFLQVILAAGKFLWEILVGKSCRKILWKMLREIVAGKSCMKILQEILAQKSCEMLQEIFQENLVG